MRKYLRVFAALFKASAIAQFEFRMNFAVKLAADIIWYVAQLSVFEVLFHHTRSISGWTIESARVFMGVLFLVDALWMMLFSENLERMSDKIRRGDLDLLLVKPINSQFMMSLKVMDPTYVVNVSLLTCWLIWALWRLPEPIVWSRLLLLFITIPCALIITYSIRFLFSASALIFTRSENITYVWHNLYRLATRPDTIYPAWLRYAVLTFLPLGFIASVPARLILETPDIVLLIASVLVASICLFISDRFWNFALRFYSSASS